MTELGADSITSVTRQLLASVDKGVAADWSFCASCLVRGGRAEAPFSSGLQATAGAAETIAPAMVTPTPSTPSPSPARPRADASRGTWRSARPRSPPPTAAGRTTTARL